MIDSTSMIAPNEVERLSAVQRYEILDTPPDGVFDRITALACRFFNVPISIVSIVDNGFIEVIGIGTTFIVTLPLKS
ncbi:MAG: hypothetical protein NVS2B14_13230 [Chamaesiphon sp.]